MGRISHIARNSTNCNRIKTKIYILVEDLKDKDKETILEVSREKMTPQHKWD